jgi:hypothetical protein
VNFGGSLVYELSPLSAVTASAGYSAYRSNITDSGVVNATLAGSHQFSPRLTASVSLGSFWSDIRTTQQILACPGPPFLCQIGFLQPVSLTIGSERHDSGQLYGADARYLLSERTDFAASLSESIQPSTVGGLNKVDALSASLFHRFSERLSGSINAHYTRTIYPAALTGSYTNDYYGGGASLTYQLTEYWTLSAGVRRALAEYQSDPRVPSASSAFITLQYGWRGFPFNPGALAGPDTLPGSFSGGVPFSGAIRPQAQPPESGLPAPKTDTP